MTGTFDTPIYLTVEDAEKYQQFLKHYDILNVLLKNKLFETRGGKIIMHFDGDGNFKGVQLERWIKAVDNF